MSCFYLNRNKTLLKTAIELGLMAKSWNFKAIAIKRLLLNKPAKVR